MNRIALRGHALLVAQRYVGTREEKRNSGPDIDQWLQWVHQAPGAPWCAAFVHACYKLAANELSTGNPWPKTASVWGMWNAVPELWKTSNPSEGCVFVHITTENTGHTGFVVSVDDGHLITCEGNTNDEGSREGDGVYLKRRPLAYADGFINVGLEGPT